MELRFKLVTFFSAVFILIACYSSFLKECEVARQELVANAITNSEKVREYFILAEAQLISLQNMMQGNIFLVESGQLSNPAIDRLDYNLAANSYFLGPSQEDIAGKRVAAVVGLGSSDEADQHLQEEQVASVALNPVFSSALAILQDLQRVYYISSRGFATIAPGSELLRGGFYPQIYQNEYWLQTLPANNPEGLLAISPLYIDATDRNPVATLTLPVLASGGFRGIVGLDINVETIIGLTASSNSRSQGIAHLIDENKKILSTKTDFEHSDVFEQSLPDKRTVLTSNEKSHVVIPVVEGQLWYVFHISANEQLLLAVQRSLLSWSFLGFLFIAIYFFVRLMQQTQHTRELNDQLELRVQERTRALSESKREAEQASEAKSAFLANISHEIRTPMNGVIGLSELLADSPLNNQQKIHVRALNSSGKLLLAVINSVLDFSKNDKEDIHLNKTPTAFLPFIEEVTAAHSIINSHVAFSVDIEPGFPDYVYVDSLRLQQVITNLLNNAFKFTHQGQVSLSVDCIGADDGTKRMQFSVTDTGIGIAEGQQEKLFFPFRQVDESTSRKYGGTGLGLSICRQIIQAMEGTINVSSVLGEGSCFSFSIPLELAEPSAPGGPEHVALQRFDTINVLLAEDNPINRLVVTSYMSKLGLQYTAVENGLLAVNTFMAEPYFDLILMDCEMPVLDGYRASTEIRNFEQDKAIARTRIVALTAHALPEQLDRCMAAGMDGRLTKPLHFKELQGLVKDIAQAQLASKTPPRR